MIDCASSFEIVDSARASVELGLLIRAARLNAGYDKKQAAFAEQVLDVTDGHLSRIERGEKLPSVALLKKLAEYGDYDKMLRLLRLAKPEAFGEMPLESVETPAKSTRADGYLPVAGAAQAGPFAAAIMRDEDPPSPVRWHFVGRSLAKRRDAFLIEARGDSMTGRSPTGQVIQDGDLLLVDPHAEVRGDGDVALATRVDGDEIEATIKLVYDAGDRWILRPTNSKRKEIRVDKEEFDAESGRIFKIVGVVDAFREFKWD